MAQIMTAELTTTVSRNIPAPAARIYDAWLNPEVLARFMKVTADGPVAEVANDPRVGGTFRIVMMDGETPIPHHGTYLELVPNKKLVFTWKSQYSVEGSMVTVNLTPEADGTRIDLRQDKFASEGARDGHNKGWTAILGQLADIL